MYPSRFEYFAPKTLDEAIQLLAKNPDEAKVLAGGQSLVSFLKLRFANPKYLVDLGRIGSRKIVAIEDEILRENLESTENEESQQQEGWFDTLKSDSVETNE